MHFSLAVYCKNCKSLQEGKYLSPLESQPLLSYIHWHWGCSSALNSYAIKPWSMQAVCSRQEGRSKQVNMKVHRPKSNGRGVSYIQVWYFTGHLMIFNRSSSLDIFKIHQTCLPNSITPGHWFAFPYYLQTTIYQSYAWTAWRCIFQIRLSLKGMHQLVKYTRNYTVFSKRCSHDRPKLDWLTKAWILLMNSFMTSLNFLATLYLPCLEASSCYMVPLNGHYDG